jgi:predicted transcriptional regulator
MKKMQTKLQSISKSLVSLSRQVDTISKQIDKLQASKSAPAAKSKKAGTKAKKPAAKAKKQAAKTKTSKKSKAEQATVIDELLGIIKKSRNGISVARLKDKTGLVSKQVSNALYKLGKKGLIIAKERGVYTKK